MSSMTQWIRIGGAAALGIVACTLLYGFTVKKSHRELFVPLVESSVPNADSARQAEADQTRIPRVVRPMQVGDAAESATRWTIRPENRIGGVESTQLASSPEAWLLTLTDDEQVTARAFLERYGDAYAFTSKAELAWLIEAGFPSIEEVVAFRKLPESVRDCVQPGQRCASSKVAVLVADEAFEQLLSNSLELPDENIVKARVRLASGMLAAGGRHSSLFALRVRAASADVRGVPYERSVALDLSAACGDFRLGTRGNSLWAALQMIERSDDPIGPCGPRAPARP